MMWMTLLSVALAGDLLVDAAVPFELRERGEVLTQTWGPERLALVGLPAGPHLLEVVAGGKARTLTVQLPESGDALLRVSATSVTADAVQRGPPPRPALEVKATGQDRLALVIDDARRLVFSGAATVRLEGLPAGEHTLEIRSSDLLTIWSRGTLTLGAEDRVVATASRGRPLDVFGPEGAWAPAAQVPDGDAPPPREP